MKNPQVVRLLDGWWFVPDEDKPAEKMPLDTTTIDMLTDDKAGRIFRLRDVIVQAIAYGRSQIKRELRLAGTEPIEGYGDGW